MTKSYFQKLLRYGYFPGKFPQYLWAALPMESYTSKWLLWIELYTVILFHYCTDFFLCSEEHGNSCNILLYNGMQKLFKIDNLPILLTGNYAAHLCFLKLWDFRKNSHKDLWNCEQRKDYCEAVRNAVKLSDTRWNRESWDIVIRLIHLGK